MIDALSVVLTNHTDSRPIRIYALTPVGVVLTIYTNSRHIMHVLALVPLLSSTGHLDTQSTIREIETQHTINNQRDRNTTHNQQADR